MADLWHWQPGHINNQAFSSCVSSTAENTNRYLLKPPRNVLDVLKMRETGLGIHSFEHQVIWGNSANLHCIGTFNHALKTSDVEFIKGGRSTLLVGWCDKEQTFIEERNLDFPPIIEAVSSFRWQYPSSYKTVDLCEIPNCIRYKILMLVMSNSTSCKAQLISKTNGDILLDHNFSTHAPVYCCTANDFSTRFAYGVNKYILVNVPDLIGQAITKQKRLFVRGEVRSVEFDKRGDVIYAGFHTGDIGMADLRSKDVSYNNLYSNGLDETVLLSDDNQLICGGFDGMLCSVDLRMRRPIFQFFGHKHTEYQKVPFSLDEFNHLLCATGTDNVTRLWNLKNGSLLSCIEPPIAETPCRAWLASNGYKFFVCLYQKSKSYIYDNL